MKNNITLKLGELFCGPGGLALGAKMARLKKGGQDYRIEHVWANDYHQDTCETYKNNIFSSVHGTVFCEDVRKLDVESLGKIDIFAYGFPCNDFSLVGKHKGFNGEFGPLYSYGIKILDRLKPRFFIAENVSGISSANDGMAFKAILEDLGSAGDGYELTAHLYKAEEYGVPQTRHRVIIVGVSKKLGGKFEVPAPTTKNNHVSVRQALEEPPISPTSFNNDLTRQSDVVLERLSHIKPGQNIWTAKLPDHLKLNIKGAKMSQIYRKLHPDKPSYTITASGGGGTHGYHYKYNRALTNRERARIQTFPDDFQFFGSKESVRRQIGMAVPPLLSKVIFQSLFNMIAGVRYESVPANIKILGNAIDQLELV